jgi:mannose/fructose/N-acetylgalactosamine-specific phosphotransferase system component IIB
MNSDLEIVELQKMIFIYNALKTGWSVKMVNNGKFEFRQSKSNVKKEVFLDDYLQKFIKDNLNIENIKENPTS